MATKVERTKEGYLISQFVGESRKKRIWRAPKLVPYGDPDQLMNELVAMITMSRDIALRGGIK